jgi:hypothetical protein
LTTVRSGTGFSWKEKLAAAGTGEGKSLDKCGQPLALQPG